MRPAELNEIEAFLYAITIFSVDATGKKALDETLVLVIPDECRDWIGKWCLIRVGAGREEPEQNRQE